MTMILDTAPIGMLLRDYRLVHGERVVAEVHLSNWRERASIMASGEDFKVVRDGWTGPFVLGGTRGRVATAQKISVWRDDFEITADDGERYRLGKAKWWSRTFVVRDRRGQTIGTVEPVGVFSQKARVHSPDDWAVELQAFVFFLVVMCWRRAAASQ